jgi:hypothetical protein
MKKLTCELCESTDFVKQDGVFVCQSCGMKYSMEEARNLMRDDGDAAIVPAGAAPAPAKNNSQIENLLKMAQTSYDSKNYAQAEEFCNRVIELDSLNYAAWKLKGEAINYQISTSNQRILEVYNCIMTSYRVLSDEEKEEKGFEVLSSLKDCLEGEMTFWIDRFEADRPTDAALKRVKEAYVDAYNKMTKAFQEMGFDDALEGYQKNFDNLFCRKCNSICVSAWKTTVAYNYFRDDLDNLGKYWNRNRYKKESGTDYFRPGDEIFSTFLDETGNLIDLLEYCTEQFNDETPFDTKKNIYDNIAYFYEVPCNQYSYKAMVSTTTNGYGAVTNRYEYYEISKFLTDGAINIRKGKMAEYERKSKLVDSERRVAEAKAEQEKKDRRKAEYWEAHAAEKEQLDAEAAELNAKRESLRQQIAEMDAAVAPQMKQLEQERNKVLPSEEAYKAQYRIVSDLESQIAGCGIFKGKLKKELQAKLSEEQPKLEQLKAAANQAKQAHTLEINRQMNELLADITPLRDEVSKCEARIRAIQQELSMDR